jgi:hypothetical protein
MCFLNCAEFQNAHQIAFEKENKTSDFCPKIYGKWEACNVYSKTYPKKKQMWTFDINGTLTVDEDILAYRLEQNCSKLFIGNKSAYSSVELRNDTLFITDNSYYLDHRFVLKLKKN